MMIDDATQPDQPPVARAKTEPAEVTIQVLVHRRMQELGLTRSDLARRLGYANPASGCTALDRFLHESFDRNQQVRTRLAAALEVPDEDVERAIAVVKRRQAEAWVRYVREQLGPWR
ncbi:MAG: hypothetical protein JNK11_20780, partial [Alphaproteobacteria bacterium]|nr:hypothetical protein [Alphaproteobacteria bacterium]